MPSPCVIASRVEIRRWSRSQVMGRHDPRLNWLRHGLLPENKTRIAELVARHPGRGGKLDGPNKPFARRECAQQLEVTLTRRVQSRDDAVDDAKLIARVESQSRNALPRVAISRFECA